MAYRVEIARRAERDLEDLYLWVIERAPQQGARWFNGFERAIFSLDQHPKRCPVAAESVDPGHPVRGDIKAKSDRVWVATYQDGAKYIRERMKAVIKTAQAGQAIEVAVTHPLDAKVYDVPLTARTTVPAEWIAAQVTQGRNTT